MVLGLCIATALLLGLHFSTSASTPTFSCRFGKGQWRPEEWIMAKCARWEHFQEHWVQEEECIRNPVPDRPKAQWLTEKGDESYISMVCRQKFGGNLTVRTTVEFEPELCPLIVFSDDLVPGKSARPEYRRYTEVLIFNQGVNVWTHFCKGSNDVPDYELAAFDRFPLQPKTRYAVEIGKIGKSLTVKIDGHCLGVLEHRLPEEVYIGITGCEGYNRFYDFSVSPLKKEDADPFLFYAYNVQFNP